MKLDKYIEQVKKKTIELAKLINKIEVEGKEFKQVTLFATIGTLLFLCTDNLIEAYGLLEWVKRGYSKVFLHSEEEE